MTAAHTALTQIYRPPGKRSHPPAPPSAPAHRHHTLPHRIGHTHTRTSSERWPSRPPKPDDIRTSTRNKRQIRPASPHSRQTAVIIAHGASMLRSRPWQPNRSPSRPRDSRPWDHIASLPPGQAPYARAPPSPLPISPPWALLFRHFHHSHLASSRGLPHNPRACNPTTATRRGPRATAPSGVAA
jgi:hypothetical protein